LVPATGIPVFLFNEAFIRKDGVKINTIYLFNGGHIIWVGFYDSGVIVAPFIDK